MRRFLVFFVPVAVLVALLMAAVHYHAASLETERLRVRQSVALARAEAGLERDFDAIASDLRLLAAASSGQRSEDMGERFRRFIRIKRMYDQVLYTDIGGGRLVVATTADQRRPLPGMRSQLLAAASESTAGRILASFQVPPAGPPVLRFATPVVGADGASEGVLALDYPLSQLYEALEADMRDVSGRRLLVGPDGITVFETDSGVLQVAELERLYPSASAGLLAQPQGQFLGDRGLLTFATVAPTTANQAPAVSILSVVDADELEAGALQRLREGFTLYAGLMLIWGLVCAGLVRLYRRRDEALRRSLMLSRVVEQTSDLVCITDPDGKIRYVNPSFERVTGYSQDEIADRPVSLLDSGEHSAQLFARLWRNLKRGKPFETVLTNRRRNGEIYHQQTTISPLYSVGGALIGYVSTGKDISDQLETETRLQQIAFHHPVTGLPNRALLRERLVEALRHARHDGHRVAVMAVDLDRFESINNSLGHEAGDTLLRAVADRLERSVRDVDSVSHPGADEFVVLLQGIEAPGEVHSYAERVLKAFQQPFRIGERAVVLSAAIGISAYPDDADEASLLLDQASIALQHAKRLGHSCYELYSEDMRRHAHRRLELESELRDALENKEFVLHYQPIVGSDGHIQGLEALLRWPRPRGVSLPDEFVPILEETGMIVPLTSWILEEATRAAAEVGRRSGTPIHMSVNVSAQSFYRGDLLDSVRRALAASELPPELLTLEVTERLLLEVDPEIREVLERLRTAGVRIAIDDFGIGYSSLAYLTRLPADSLKIDRAFIHGMDVDSRDAALVSGILAMARQLDIETVAEGVETAHQLSFLRDHQCDRLQGFFFSVPLPMSTIQEHLERDQRWPWKPWMPRLERRKRPRRRV